MTLKLERVAGPSSVVKIKADKASKNLCLTAGKQGPAGIQGIQGIPGDGAALSPEDLIYVDSPDIGEALADDDEFPVSNTSSGSSVVSALSRVWTYVLSKMPFASQAEMEAGTETSTRSMSPERVKQAIAALSSGGDLVDDSTPQLGGDLDLVTHSIVTTAGRDITLAPNSTGNIVLGTVTLDADQAVGVGQDNFVLTYDNATGLLSLEESGGGGGDLVDDLTPQLGGDLDLVTHSIVTTSDRDITLSPNGIGNIVLGTVTLDADQTVGVGQDNYVLTYDNATGLLSLEEAAAGGGGGDLVDDLTPQLGGDLDTNEFGFVSSVADGASAVAFSLDTANALATSGAKLLSLSNNGLVKAEVTKDGALGVGIANPLAQLDVRLSGGTKGPVAYFGNETGGRFGVFGVSAANSFYIGGTSLGETLTFKLDDVGINESNPSAKLHIQASVTNNEVLIVSGMTGQTGDVVKVLNNGSTWVHRITSSGQAAFGNINALTISSAMHIKGFGSTSSTYALKTEDSSGALLFSVRDDGNVGIGTASPDSLLDVNGAITQHELSADPADPAEGSSVTWQSDGTGSGDDGDIMMKITAGGTTKTVTLVDFSAA